MNQSAPNPYEAPKTMNGLHQAHDHHAVVRVTRTTSSADRLRAYHIVIDGEKREKIKAGQTVDVPVLTGHHHIRIAVDWCGSPSMEFDIQPGQIVEFECGSNLLGLRVFLAAWYAFFSRNKYLTLKRNK